MGRSMTTTTEPARTTIDYFESIYAAAHGDPRRLPWAHTGPTTALVNWLNAEAPSLVRCGTRVAVVGCGLGENAREVRRRGYEVTGFDGSETAVRWARSLDPECVEGYVQADLFDPPARWVRRFDLVVEVDNIESLSPDRHQVALDALANLMTPHGLLLVICRGSSELAGPRWPLSETRLQEMAAAAALRPHGPICSFIDDDENPPVPRIRAVFCRS
jgi:2-polyprenyl-3-methyl-5-hydroxy-6-metoxy-1,4-benzoquinol methylase